MIALLLAAAAATVPGPQERTVELLQAMQRRDAKAMEAIVLDDLQFTTVGQKVIGKAQYVEAYTKHMQLVSFEISGFRAVVRGDAAATTYVLQIDTGAWKPRLAMSDTWVRDGGAWRLLARHATEVKKKE